MGKNKEERKRNYIFYNPALSWLSFNNRVLEEAMDYELPLFERIRFLSIHQENLEKFFRTAITSHRLKIDMQKSTGKSKSIEMLMKIYDEILRQQKIYETCLLDQVIPDLLKNDIELIINNQFTEKQKQFTNQYFLNNVYPHLQAIIVQNSDFSNYIQDNEIYLIFVLGKKKEPNYLQKGEIKKNTYSIVQIPLEKVNRIIEIPSQHPEHKAYAFIEDVIKQNSTILFPFYHVEACFSFSLFRNTKLKIEDELKMKDIVQMHKAYASNQSGFPALFQFDREMQDELIKLIKKQLNLQSSDLFPGWRYVRLSDLKQLLIPIRPYLEPELFNILKHPGIEQEPSFLKALKKKDFLLHFPYQLFDYVLRFFNEAAIDPKVEEIRATQYKIEYNSAILSSLLSAAMNGKKVYIYVDFKARFDHSHNLSFIEKITKAGVRIIPSIAHHKVHAKLALITRRTSGKEGKTRNFAYLGTGNFNEKTAQQYTDHSYFTCKQNITDDVKKFFAFLDKPVGSLILNHLAIPKFNYNSSLKQLINNELVYAKNGANSFITIKNNNLEDKRIIKQLYHASLAGVKINLIIRGICSIVPDERYGNNIHICRIVDRFLEHTRILIFGNQGNPKVYLSSADFIERHLKRRIDILIPIYDEEIKQQLIHYIQIQLHDNEKSRILMSEKYHWEKPEKNELKIRSQTEIHNYLGNLYQV